MFQTQRPRQLLHNIFPFKFSHFPAAQTRKINTVSPLLNLCKNPNHLKQIHARFILYGLHKNQTLASTLIEPYTNFGLLNSSAKIFNTTPNKNPILFKQYLKSLFNIGEYKQTILVYNEMRKIDLYPDEEMLCFVLKACYLLNNFDYARLVHGYLLKSGFESFGIVSDALIVLYNKGSVDFENEYKVTDKMSQRDLSEWNGLIFEACQNGNALESFQLFNKMRTEGVVLDLVTAINLLRSCTGLSSLKLGRVIHCMIVVNRLNDSLTVNTALLSMYSKLNSLEVARLLFQKMPEKDVVVWNIMISAYSQNGFPMKSLDLLRSMAAISKLRPDLFTAIPVISSVRQLKSIKWGKQIHSHVLRNGSDYQVSVHNALIDMYCECGHLTYARKVFDLVMDKSAISWSSIIKGYANHDLSLDALSLFYKMKLDGVNVDFITMINIIPACVNIGVLELLKYLHGYSLKSGLTSLSSVNTAILISYAKCGCIEMARKLFDEESIGSKDIITWNSMISACAKHGDWTQCRNLYDQMKKSNLEPDQVTFLGLLTACVNSGLVKEGREIFNEMTEIYRCKSSQEHYACMVDLLGRAGHIDEAKQLVQTMPFEADAKVWGPLLSACKLHSDQTKVVEFAAEKLISMEPKNAGNYVLLSNIYAAAGKWDRVAEMRMFLRDKGLKKILGCSWLEINGKVHEFRVADRSHPEANAIYKLLGNLEMEIAEIKGKALRKPVWTDTVYL